jgi:hypothetical protein
MTPELSRRVLVALTLISLAWPIRAAEYRLLPEKIVLHGPHDRQRVVLAILDGGKIVGQYTAAAKFQIQPAGIASIDGDGVVWPRQNGQATLTVQVQDGATLQVPISVGNMESSGPSFRHEVLPMLTRAGCNSGACHGALAGKGGLKLSLRGYDPEADYYVLTRQVLGRRIDLAQPHRSLLLLKPTMTVNHGGGLRYRSGFAGIPPPG